MSEKSIIIIGAGVAGLTSGIYAQMNGYKTQIFEKHFKPGGLCTSWERKGYIIDGCLHWLVGSSPDSSYHHMWQEVGALQGKQIINLEQLYQIETSSGKVVTLYTDVDRLEKHLKEIGPEDSAFIEELTGAIRRIERFDLSADKAMELYNFVDYLMILPKILPFMGTLRKWSNLTIKELTDRFQNTSLKEAFRMLWPPQYSCIFLMMSLAWMAKKNAGYVIGGSLELALAMEKRYFELGGKVNYKAAVEKILVENNRAVGIKLADGSEIKADYVISAADGHATIFDLLEGKYVDDKIRGYYATMPIFEPLVFIGLGVNRSFEDVPKLISGVIFPLDKPLMIGKKEHRNLSAHIYNYDPSFAAVGKTAITVLLESDYAYWEELRKDLPKYEAEKERIAAAVVSALNKRFPGFNDKLEMWDVATPVTFKRYTGNWQGSYEGWLLTAKNLTLQMKKTLPGLANFYMVGQWVSPGGGLPSGLITGNHVVQILCRKDQKKFSAKKPSTSSGVNENGR